MQILVSACLLLGSIIILLSALGILKLPDALCRGHALGKGMTMGLILILIGLWLYHGLKVAGIKVPLVVLFQFLTIPISSHLLVRMAFREKGNPEVKPVDRSSAEK